MPPHKWSLTRRMLIGGDESSPEASYTGTPMHVVVASHHRLPVEGYGGPQRVVVALVQALAALGHRVTVLAQPGTKLAAASRIIEVSPRALKSNGGSTDLTSLLPDNADILHAHFPLKQGPKSVPFVQTLHGNW